MTISCQSSRHSESPAHTCVRIMFLDLVMLEFRKYRIFKTVPFKLYKNSVLIRQQVLLRNKGSQDIGESWHGGGPYVLSENKYINTRLSVGQLGLLQFGALEPPQLILLNIVKWRFYDGFKLLYFYAIIIRSICRWAIFWFVFIY